MRSPLLSGLGSRGSAIGAVYARRKTLAARKVTLRGQPAPRLEIGHEVRLLEIFFVRKGALLNLKHTKDSRAFAGPGAGSLPAAGEHPGGAEGVLVALHVPVAVATQDAPDPPRQVGTHLHQ